MGHRLSKIYTRTGDDGTTGLGDGSRTEKDSLRVEAFGDSDELNSCIGMLLTHDLPTNSPLSKCKLIFLHILSARHFNLIDISLLPITTIPSGIIPGG